MSYREFHSFKHEKLNNFIKFKLGLTNMLIFLEY